MKKTATILLPKGVEIMDEFTGRVLPGRRFTDGVHQAIEAKEGVDVKSPTARKRLLLFRIFSGLRKVVRHERHRDAGAG